MPLEQMMAALQHLRDAPDAAFDFCSDVTATDWPPRKEARFDLSTASTRRGFATAFG